jgi:hypothetical protein
MRQNSTLYRYRYYACKKEDSKQCLRTWNLLLLFEVVQRLRWWHFGTICAVGWSAARTGLALLVSWHSI